MLEPSRRFFETQRFFDALGNSGMSHSDIRVGPVLASTIYLFDPSVPGPKSGKEEFTLTQLRGAPPRFETMLKKPHRQTRAGLDSQISPGDSYNDSALPREEI